MSTVLTGNICMCKAFKSPYLAVNVPSKRSLKGQHGIFLPTPQTRLIAQFAQLRGTLLGLTRGERVAMGER